MADRTAAALKRVTLSVPHDMSTMRETSPKPKAGAEDRKITRIGDWVAPANSGASRSSESAYVPLAGGEVERSRSGRLASICQATGAAVVSKVPILHWFPRYNYKENFLNDFIGGATIALICLVQTLAHAAIATTKVVQGPYCAFVPPLVYAMLGTSPHASVSSGAIAAILIADQLQYFQDLDERTELASLLALISGGWLIIMGLCNAAFAVRFLSQSLISGFVTGGSILIIQGQLKNLLGLSNVEHAVGFIGTSQALIRASPQTNYVGLALGLCMMGLLQLMMFLKKYSVAKLKEKGPHPKWLKPAKFLTEMKELVLVAVSVTFAYATAQEDGEPILPTVGLIQPGLPSFMPAWRWPASQTMLETHYRLQEFFFGGFLVALTSFLTTYATSKKQALQHNYTIDASQEMLALGCAGAAGSFFGSFTPSGSLSRTSLASEVGVKTQMSGLMKVVVVGISLQYLTPVIYYLPKAALAAIILRSTWTLVDFKTAKELWQDAKPYHQGGMFRDNVVWWIAFVLTVFLGVLYGIGIAVLASLVMIVRDAAMPRVVILGCIESLGSVWRDAEVWPEGRTWPGILVIEFRGPLSFASADWFQEELDRKRREADARSETKVSIMVLAFGSVHDLDKTAIETLRECLREWRKRGVSCIIAEAKSRVRLLLEEHFGRGKAPLLDQPAFIIGISDAVALARRTLARRRGDPEVAAHDDGVLSTTRPSNRSPHRGWRGAATAAEHSEGLGQEKRAEAGHPSAAVVHPLARSSTSLV